MAACRLKIIWAILDVVTIAVLITGLYLWVARRRRAAVALRRMARSNAKAEVPAMDLSRES